MRKATGGQYPRFALWENVPGAFSSQKGEDFRVVLEELIRIAEPRAVMPPVPKAGWAYADSYTGVGWSLAYRVFDAQYWGVPQRRRRIHLAIDLRGECAGKILFERDGLRGYFEEGRTPWQGAAPDAQGSLGAADREGEGYGGDGGRQLDAVSILNPFDSQGNRIADGTGNYVFPTLRGCGGAGYQVGYVLAEANIGHRLRDVAYTLKIRSGCEGGGKGALIQTDRSATLADQYLFQPVAFSQNQRDEVRDLGDKAGALQAQPGMKQQTFIAESKVFSFDSLASNSMKSKNPHSGCREVTVAKTLDTTDPNPCKNQGGIAIVEPVCVDFGRTADRIYINPKTSVTLSSQGGGMGAKTGLYLLPADPVYCLQGNGIDRADTAGCNGKGRREDQCYTLNTIDRPAVAFQSYQKVTGPLMANSHPGSYTGQDAFSDMLVAGPVGSFQNTGAGWWNESSVGATLRTPCGGDSTMANVVVAGVDCRNMNEYPELYPTLQAKPNGGQSLNFSGAVRKQYIVRRLTPTECARLQGFPDWWGHIAEKDELTDEEYSFWCKVLLEYAEIQGTARPNENGDYEIWREVKPDKKKGEDFDPYWENTGKPYKHKTKKQMIAWYNKLHTDGAEYKMWGNGVSLPTILFCMQGIVEALERDEDAWLL